MGAVILMFVLIGIYYIVRAWLFQDQNQYGPFPPEALFIKYRDGTHEYLSDGRYWTAEEDDVDYFGVR